MGRVVVNYVAAQRDNEYDNNVTRRIRSGRIAVLQAHPDQIGATEECRASWSKSSQGDKSPRLGEIVH